MLVVASNNALNCFLSAVIAAVSLGYFNDNIATFSCLFVPNSVLLAKVFSFIVVGFPSIGILIFEGYL